MEEYSERLADFARLVRRASLRLLTALRIRRMQERPGGAAPAGVELLQPLADAGRYN